MYRVAFCLAILVTPAMAYSWAEVERTVGADVVADTDSFVKVEDLAPVVTAFSAWMDDAVRITHQYVTGTTLDVTATKTAPTGSRWQLVDASGSVAAGASHTVRIRDTSILHPAGTTAITIQLDVVIRDAGAAAVGTATVTRIIEVTA